MPKPTLKAAQKPRDAIYEKRQPKRPHYLAALLKLKNIDRGTLIEDLGIDKGQVSRWLSEDNPSTPSGKWADKLGWYFAPGPDDDDFVDIFTDPSVARFQRLVKGRSQADIDRIFATIEAAFSLQKRTGT